MLPRFSCHSLRHTFTTRLIENNVNLKFIQDALGHKDVQTTLNIYADVTTALKKKEFSSLEDKLMRNEVAGLKNDDE
ncbi:tyrosine-type recombinase/integrase [Lacrimispora sphenoides]|nr:tyrosine-type recombinase/integrase [Lacrimispora sphenoides]